MISISVNGHLDRDCEIRVARVGNSALIEFRRVGVYPSITLFVPEFGDDDFANALRAAADAIVSKSEAAEIPISNKPMETEE